MAGNADLGTIWAHVALELKQLASDRAAARAEIAGLAADIKAEMGKAQQAASEKLAQQTAALKTLTTAALTTGAAITTALASGVKIGAEYEAMLNHVANNTSLTNDEIAMMRETVERLGKAGGASLTELAQGFMHITNFGFRAADATKILDTAMKSAVATGGDTGKTAEILANVMHEFSLSTNQAAAAMNLLHIEANKGNMTLEQMVEAGGPAFAMAANLGVKLGETAAAMAALTQHGFTAAEAATQVRNILAHMAQPVKHVRELLAVLSKTTGVDLVHDFSVAGLQAKGMAGILEDVKKAARLARVSVQDLMMHLVPAMRGGVGAMALAGTAATDFKDRLKDAADMMAGKADPTSKQYAKTLGTLDQQVKIAKNNLMLLADDVEKALLPALQDGVKSLREMVEWFSKLSPEVKNNTIKIASWVAGILVAVGTAAKLAAGVVTLTKSLAALGVTVEAVGGLIAALTGPIGLAVGALAALVLAFKNDWGHIQDVTGRAITAIGDLLTGKWAKAWDGAKKIAVDAFDAIKRGWKSVVDDIKYSAQDMTGKWVYPEMHKETSGAKAPNDRAEAKPAAPMLADAITQLRKQLSAPKSPDAGKQTVRETPPLRDVNDLFPKRVKARKKVVTSEWEQTGGAVALLNSLMAVNNIQKKLWNKTLQDYADADAKMVAYYQQTGHMEQQLDKEKWDAILQNAADADAKMVAYYQQTGNTEQQLDKEKWDAILQNAADADAKMVAYYQVMAQETAQVNERIKQDSLKVWEFISQGAVNILSNSFFKTMKSGFKNLFGDILQGFADMIEKMIAKWLAMQAVMGIAKLFGLPFSGDFLGGLFGFDDVNNDRKAQHWGYDFGKYFTNGMADYKNHSLATANASGSPSRGSRAASVTTGDIVIHLHNAQNLDASAVGKAVAWEMSQRLRAVVGS